MVHDLSADGRTLMPFRLTFVMNYHRIHRAPLIGYRREASWTAVLKVSGNGLQTRPRGKSL
jgi:hypothetical protein